MQFQPTYQYSNCFHMSSQDIRTLNPPIGAKSPVGSEDFPRLCENPGARHKLKSSNLKLSAVAMDFGSPQHLGKDCLLGKKPVFCLV
jgi:hypothetical protein